MLYGTGELKGVGDAFWRGAKTGALSSGFRNIEEALWPERSRDPKGMCGSPDPFELSQGFGNGRGYQSPSAHGEGGFSLGGLVKDMVVGGIVGGLGSAGFYGAGKALDALKESFVGKKCSKNLEVRDRKFLNADGDIDWDTWAPNGGRVPGTVQEKQTINAGIIIDRYGSANGRYVSPVGIPYEQRALPYVENPNAYHRYRVLKAIDDVTISQIAEAFEQPGGGIQYELPVPVKKLIRKRVLKEIR